MCVYVYIYTCTYDKVWPSFCLNFAGHPACLPWKKGPPCLPKSSWGVNVASRSYQSHDDEQVLVPEFHFGFQVTSLPSKAKVVE